MLATGKTKHSASIAKRKIVEEKLELNPPVVPTERNVQRIAVLTKLHAKTILTSLRNNWKLALTHKVEQAP